MWQQSNTEPQEEVRQYDTEISDILWNGGDDVSALSYLMQ